MPNQHITLKLTTAVFAKMLDNFKHLTWLVSESQSLAAKITTEEICSAAKKTKLPTLKEKSMRNHLFLHLGRQFLGLSLSEVTCVLSNLMMLA
jgi:hypothetical protein